MMKHLKDDNKKLYTILSVFLMVAVLLTVFIFTDNKDLQKEVVKEATNMASEMAHNAVTISNETQELAEETKEEVSEGQDISTKEEITSTQEDENKLEADAKVEQENVSYDGTNTGNGKSLLGAYQGLTYYSQQDSRWKNIMYSSIGDRSQTIGSSGCGPTSAAMVVSSSKGSILPTTMANLAVDNGYRTAGNGTAWAYFSFVADYFGFNEYRSTSDYGTAFAYLRTGKYFAVVSCNSGLWTTGGHYIVLVGDDNGRLTVYDPYLYAGKFSTASRRGANVTVSGNSAYLSEYSFIAYSNQQNFWIFSNDSGSGNTNTKPTQTTYTRYVSTESLPLNVRNAPNGAVIGSLPKGTQVTVYGTSGNWSDIGSGRWVSSSYLSSVPPSSAPTKKITGYTTGKYKVTGVQKGHILNVRKDSGTNYRAKTYKELTVNARSQNKALGNYYANGYLNGVVCTVTQVSGNWGKVASGWICLDYCSKD